MDGEGTGPAGGQENGHLLQEMRVLRRRARAARHAYWFPLLLFGVLTCASVPFCIHPGVPSGQAGQAAWPGPQLPMLGGHPGFLVQRYLGYYWLAALLCGLLLTLLWYRRNARRVGLQTPARGYVITVAVLTVLALAVPPLSRLRSPRQLSWLQHLQVLWPGDLVVRGTFPFVIIAAGLWALAWAERSRALAVIAAIYTAPRCCPACTTPRTSSSGSAGALRTRAGAWLRCRTCCCPRSCFSPRGQARSRCSGATGPGHDRGRRSAG